MIILDHVYTKEEVLAINDFQNGFVKGVVDVEKGYVALDADMHYQLADYLRETQGSKEEDMWGFNLWLENEEIEDILEYDSLINLVTLWRTTLFPTFLLTDIPRRFLLY